MRRSFCKRVFAVVLAIALILAGLPALGYQKVNAAPGDAFTVDEYPGFTFWEKSDSEVSVSSYSTTFIEESDISTEVIVPGTVTYEGVTYTVIGIEGSAFNSISQKIKKIILPETITYIENNAFSGCNTLEAIDLSDSIKVIGDYAFENCQNLFSITLPASLETIGSGAFYRCTGLTGTLVIPKKVNTIGNSAFSYDYGITGIEFASGSELESIGYNAFYNCYNITGTLELPDKLTSIADLAFYNTNITDLILPISLTTVGGSAFYSKTPPKTIANNSSHAFKPADIISNSLYVYKSGLTPVEEILNTDGTVNRALNLGSSKYLYRIYLHVPVA